MAITDKMVGSLTVTDENGRMTEPDVADFIENGFVVDVNETAAIELIVSMVFDLRKKTMCI